MKENLSIQFVYPSTRVPEELQPVINSIDHINIVPETNEDKELIEDADIIISHDVNRDNKIDGKIYIVRMPLSALILSVDNIKKLIAKSVKVNVVVTDVANFSKASISLYKSFLQNISDYIVSETIRGNSPQLNIVTDRFMLSKMNNCNAGCESVAVSGEGKLYPCPAFLDDSLFVCGDIQNGPVSPNLRLLNISNSPICKTCDAFHCKRCVWLNLLLTHEVNTPGWQQCVIAHLEREAARQTLNAIRLHKPDFLDQIEIPMIDYIDPFTNIERL